MQRSTPDALPVTVAWPVSTTPIDLNELDDCLVLYYRGLLDHVPDSCLCNLTESLSELIPGRPLESQLDQETMGAALQATAVQHHITIDLVHTGQAGPQDVARYTGALGALAIAVWGLL